MPEPVERSVARWNIRAGSFHQFPSIGCCWMKTLPLA